MICSRTDYFDISTKCFDNIHSFSPSKSKTELVGLMMMSIVSSIHLAVTRDIIELGRRGTFFLNKTIFSLSSLIGAINSSSLVLDLYNSNSLLDDMVGRFLILSSRIHNLSMAANLFIGNRRFSRAAWILGVANSLIVVPYVAYRAITN